MTVVEAPTEWLTPARLAQALGVPPPTPEQAAVIAAPASPALVVAGAGAGKTETMAARVVWLVATGAVLPEQVLGLTFTRKAAQQLAERVRARLRRLAGSRLLDDLDPTGTRKAALNGGDGGDVTVATYHAYAGRLVGEHALRLPAEPGARLLSETAAWQLAHRVVSTWAADLDVDRVPATVTGYLLALAGELGEHLVEPGQLRTHAEAFIALVENAPRAKGQRAALAQDVRRMLDSQRLRVALLPLVEAFTARKRAERAMDFADQMAIAARIAAEHPDVGRGERERYRAVLLDEYQDTGHAQRVLLRSLFRTAEDEAPIALTAVGDPCQSIYGWRGASAANLPRFSTDFPVRDTAGALRPAPRYGLLTSFRNPAEVLALANAVSEPLRLGAQNGSAHAEATLPGSAQSSSAHSQAMLPTSAQSKATPKAHVEVDELRPLDGAAPGSVRIALLTDVTEETAWTADALAARWHAAVDSDEPPPTAAVLVRRRADMAPMAAALRARNVPVEVVGLGGLLTEPEVRDLVSALRLVADPLAGTAAMRLLTGARWRVGAADLAALWARAKELAAPLDDVGQPGRKLSREMADLVDAALPGEHAEQAGLVDALDDPGPPEHYSEAGYQRIRKLAGELIHLRGRAGGASGTGWAGLPDLVADTERALLLDVETAARPGPAGRAHLDAFADVVSEFAAGAEVPTLPALLDYLATAEQAEDGLRPGEVAVADDRVQILTVHAAKGLEWQVVAVPNLVRKVFPAVAKTGSWLTNPAELPVELRGDAPDLPDPTLPADGDRKEVLDAIKAHKEALDERRRSEERRLLYVAITRAERTLLLSGHWWAATGDRPRGPSEFLEELNEIAERSASGTSIGAERSASGTSIGAERSAGGTSIGTERSAGGTSINTERSAGGTSINTERSASGTSINTEAHPELVVEHWAPQPADDEPNPVTATPRTARWPIDPLGDRRDGVHQGATMVRAALAKIPTRHAQLELFATGDQPERPARDELEDPEGWASDVDALLAERAALQAARPEVALPAALSVSQLVELAADPEALAARLRRPMPFPPNPHARRGTAFHAWLEQRFGATRLLDLDELPGAADDGAAPDAELDELRAAFLASQWADRRPIEVEVPFETELDGIGVRGRMDAVFADPDGGWTVVDWKTGAVPDEARLPALAVQLAAYRLAWAALTGRDVAQVRAAFHYVRSGVSLRPADLLDADGLRALLDSVPPALPSPP